MHFLKGNHSAKHRCSKRPYLPWQAAPSNEKSILSVDLKSVCSYLLEMPVSNAQSNQYFEQGLRQ
jgi:hypothetical protein